MLNLKHRYRRERVPHWASIWCLWKLGRAKRLWMIVNLVTFATWRKTTRDE